jgi:hypothetical protein
MGIRVAGAGGLCARRESYPVSIARQDEIFAIADVLCALPIRSRWGITWVPNTDSVFLHQQSRLLGHCPTLSYTQETVLSSISIFHCLTLKEACIFPCSLTFNGTVPREGRPMCVVVQCASGVWGRPETQPFHLLAQAHAITTRSRTRDVDIDECANAPCPCGRWERQPGRSAAAAFRVTHDALNTPKITVQETKRI